MQEPKFNPYAALAIGVASVSASAILVKASSAPSGVIAFYRLLFTVLLMLPFFLLKNFSELKMLTKKDFFLSIIAGVFLAFHFILWFESLNYTSVASSTVLVTLQPLFAFVGAFLFFKERFSVTVIISGIIAITGSLIISWGDFQISGLALWGDILALTACALITAYLLFGQAVRKRVSSTTYTFVVYGISTITLFLYVLVSGESFGPYPTIDWIYFILLAVFPNLLGHSLFNWSLKWLSTTTISMAILMEPVGASILAYFILDEKIIWTQALGGFVVLAGLMLFLRDKKKTEAAESSL
ncbi:DMT family transporter [Bacillus sp. V59.32b]|uniref:DMT family transporter n=1 Tax=Bacillus sp. V59.32b TaxID=1758642 RepID=UPI000E3D8E88|nr:DMT family transporter [Bacillus sp. V59.32b]RFU60298.1 DMT family transporter [Bacillus sp. V59.32b]